MTMRRVAMLAATAAVVGSSMLFGAPAQATGITTTCSTSLGGQPWKFWAGAMYTTEDGYQHWDRIDFKLTGNTTGGSSSVHARLRTGGHSDNDPTHWWYNSPDTLNSNVGYQVAINKTIPVTNQNYLKFDAFFDGPWWLPDPSCKAYVDSFSWPSS